MIRATGKLLVAYFHQFMVNQTTSCTETLFSDSSFVQLINVQIINVFYIFLDNVQISDYLFVQQTEMTVESM